MQNKSLWYILLSMLLGFLCAAAAIHWNLDQFVANYIQPIGTTFLRLLICSAIILVPLEIITGMRTVASEQQFRRVGFKIVGMYLGSTLLAIGLAMLLGNSFQVGKSIGEEDVLKKRYQYEWWTANVAEIEPIDGLYYTQSPTDVELWQTVSTTQAQKELDDQQALAALFPKAEKQPIKNGLAYVVDLLIPGNIIEALSEAKSLLQVIFFAVLMGFMIIGLPAKQTAPFVAWCESLKMIIHRLIGFVMKGTVVFVFSLIVGSLTPLADSLSELARLLASLLQFALLVSVGLMALAFLIYPSLVHVFTKDVSFRDFLRKIAPAQVVAFSTSSSAATLPETLRVALERLGISPSIAGCSLSIGSVGNMDGTSFYQTLCILFLAQLHGIDLGLLQQVNIALLVTAASIGAASVPSGGLVLLLLVLQYIGLNPSWILIIYPTDRILDMLRTLVNVSGDLMVTTIIDRSERRIEKA